MKYYLFIAITVFLLACNDVAEDRGKSNLSKDSTSNVPKEKVADHIKMVSSSANTVLNFTIQKQPELHLCWAAVAASISKFYDNAAPYKQCDIANYAFGSSTCCQNLPTCDRDWFLDRALKYTNNLQGSILNGEPSWDVIKNEITNGHVIAIRIEWRDNHEGHFIVIHGFHDDQTVDVQDPWPTRNPGNILLTKLAMFYNDIGGITHYYLTKRTDE